VNFETPLVHPVEGRVVLGVGIGYQADDFRAFNVPFEARMALFEESVEIIRQCWAGEKFSFAESTTRSRTSRSRHGRSRGRPPLWIGASVPAAARRAGRIADGFVGTPSTGMENATRLADLYKAAAREAGRPADVIQMRDAWVATTRAEADAVYGPHVMMAYRYYWEHRLAEFASMPAETKFTLENLAPDRLILGEPETCVREFQRWQKATGASTFLLRLRHAHSGGPPHAEIMKAIKLFGDRVLPYCR